MLESATTLTTTNTFNSCGILTSVSGNSHVNTTAGSVTGTPTYDGSLNVVRNVTTVNAYSVTRTIQTTHPIDAHGRNMLSYFKVDAGVDRIISSRVYNAKEQLITNYQGGTGLSGNLAYLQKLDYSYLPNGLLSTINNNVLTGTQALYSVCTAPAPALPPATTYDDKDIFSLLLYYNNPISGTNAVADKSGNIVNMKWQVRGREEQVYGFLYDTYSRLTQSRHYDYNGAALQAYGRYNTDYTYDKRGNILTLDRNGRTSMADCTSWGAIDDLNYTYPANTNKLTNVTDAIVGAAGDEGFKNTTSTSYTYDTNGNLTYDADKGVTITYNHLNLPKKISYSGSKYMEMAYDAAGNMLSRRTIDTGVDDLIDYIAGIEYFDGVTQSIMHEEGRVYYTSPTTSRYEYTISDHLGNARLMYTDLNADGKVATPSEILWEGQYYPFGLAHNGAWMDQADPEINYKYNGIELAKDLGINVNLATFRTLDPAVGRWWQVDPRAEAIRVMSPYQSMNNNPVSYADPEGDIAWFVPVLIGAAVGGTTGGVIASNNGQSFLKGFTVGAIAGAGVGLGVSWGLSAAGANVSGIYASTTATGALPTTTTAAWNITSNALITANINMASSAIQGRDLTGVMSSGLVGLGSGAIGGYIGGKFDEVGRSSTAKFFSDKATKATNYITAGLNGFGDRYVSSRLNGENGKQSLINGLFGLGEGLYLSHFWGNKFVGVKGTYESTAHPGLTGRYLSSAITQAGTSIPGFGYSVASYHNMYAAWTGGFYGPDIRKLMAIPNAGLHALNIRFLTGGGYENTYTSSVVRPEDFLSWLFR